MTFSFASRASAVLFGVALAAGLALANSPPPPTTQPLDPNAKPATQPADLVKVKTGDELLRPGGPGPLTTKPAAPATQPTVKVADKAKELLESVVHAYHGLASLRTAGTINADMDLNGMKSNQRGSFTGAWRKAGEGIGEFRLGARDGKAEQDSIVVGLGGKTLYVYDAARKYYMTATAPQSATASLPRPYGDLVENQDPVLLLVLAAEPRTKLLDEVEAVDVADEVDVGGKPHPALKLSNKDGSVTVVAVDSKTHLIRRIVADLRKPAEKSGQQDVKKLLITYEYSVMEPGANLAGENFAWSASDGYRDVGGANALALGGGDEDGGGGPASALEGKAAPDFRLKDADGKEVALADLKGNVVLLDFWATWCGPCVASLPHLDQIYKDLQGKGLKAYAVNLREEQDDVAAFVTRTKLSIPVIFDTDGKVSESFSVQGIPQTVVVGKDGVIKKVVVGSGTHDTIRRAIEDALK